MTIPRLTALSYLLLGLLKRRPQSGYRLTQQIEATPMTRFSASPGAVYPALSRLTAAGLVTASAGSRGRGRGRVYALTQTGRTTLGNWVTGPITAHDVTRHLDLTLLRVSFLAEFADERGVREFAARYRDAAAAVKAELGAFVEAAHIDLALSPRLAFDLVLSIVGSQEEWAAAAADSRDT